MWKGFKTFILGAVLFMSMSVMAQDNSPYSRFGLGLLSQTNFIESRSMGGLGASFNSPHSVNFANPASYAHLRLISFEGGVSGSINNVSTDLTKGRTGQVNLSYLNFSMPIKKDIWVTSFGVLPFSQSGYLVADSTTFNENSTIANIFEGSGTLYSVYWGNGFKVKDFSVGFNIGYLFGNIDGTVINAPISRELSLDLFAYSAVERSKFKASGVIWNVGAQYRVNLKEETNAKELKNKLFLDIGFAFNSKHKVGNKNSLTLGQYSIYNNVLANRDERDSYAEYIDGLLEGVSDPTGTLVDTITAPVTTEVGLTMPMNINVGFTFVKNNRGIDHWKAGFDFKYTPWSKYEGFETGSGGTLNDSWRVAVGGELFPIGADRSEDLRSKFFSQLKYRAGFYYERTPVTVQNSNIDEFGINFGLSIPVRLRIVNDEGYYAYTAVHPFTLGFEVGRRGSRQNGLIRDNFVRINFGISLNDKWFVKSRYN